MNTTILIDKLRNKVKESNEYVINTMEKQNKFISSQCDLNLKLRNYIEADINEKNTFADAQTKASLIKTRVENCKLHVNNIKERIKNIKNKYQI